MRNLIIVLVLSAFSLSAQDNSLVRPPAPKARTLWKASLLTLAAANALDIHSSWGKHELNPVLSTGPKATFGAQGALIKAGLQGGLAGLEYLITRGHPTGKAYKVLSFVNFGTAGALGAAAAHNYTVAPAR